jgi:glyoxylase-like metal-dependent hydrolase (beta-lactamase superfamily II)
MHTWKVGDVRITRLQEQEPVWPGTMILKEAVADNVKREGEWLDPFCNDGNFRLSIHALLVESEGKRILVDTCVGNDKTRPGFKDWDHLHLPFLQNLEKAGVTRDSIDTVLATHLHLDHVGWNTTLENGKWVPTFPKDHR